MSAMALLTSAATTAMGSEAALFSKCQVGSLTADSLGGRKPKGRRVEVLGKGYLGQLSFDGQRSAL